MLGHLGAISEHLDSTLGHVGGKMRQDSDQEHQVEPNMGDWRLPDGKYEVGWVVNERLLGHTSNNSQIASLENSKTLSL